MAMHTAEKLRIQNALEELIFRTTPPDNDFDFYTIFANTIMEILDGSCSSPQLHNALKSIQLPQYRSAMLDANRLFDEDPIYARNLVRKFERTFYKHNLPARYNKYGRNYSGNPFGLCRSMTAAWLIMHMEYAESSVKRIAAPKEAFYDVTSHESIKSFSDYPSKTEKEEHLLEKFRSKNVIDTADESFLLDKLFSRPFASVSFIRRGLLSSMIASISFEMSRLNIQELAIYMESGTINHAMGMMIKKRSTYISIVFYDPNARHGDVKINLPLYLDHTHNLQMSELIEPLFRELHTLYIAKPGWGMADFTLICLNPNPFQATQLTLPIYPIEQSPEKYLFFPCDVIDPLAFAAYKLLLSNGMLDINFYREKFPTPLYDAAAKGHVRKVQLLLQYPNINVNLQCPHGEESPLFVAVCNTHVQVVKLLLKHPKIEINLTTSNGTSALHIAAGEGDFVLTELLLKNGANPRLRFENLTALEHAEIAYEATQSKKYLSVIKLLKNQV